MPGFDRTGPMGYGPRTGRGLGPCGRGMAFRRGFGRGFGRFAEPVNEKEALNEELKVIEEEKKFLDQDAAEIKKRLKELK